MVFILVQKTDKSFTNSLNGMLCFYLSVSASEVARTVHSFNNFLQFSELDLRVQRNSHWLLQCGKCFGRYFEGIKTGRAMLFMPVLRF